MTKAKKLVTAKLNLASAKEFNPEIGEKLIGIFDKAKYESFLNDKYRALKAGETRIKTLDEVTAEFHWILPNVVAEAENMHKQALQAARNKQYKESIALWVRAISLNPDDPDYYFNAGIAFFELKNYREAIDNLEYTIQLCPIYYKARLILGTVYLKLRKFEKAESHLRESVSFHPDNTLALLNLATACSVLKKYDDGIKIFNQIIKLNEKETRAHFGLGKIYNLQGDIKKANDCFHKVVEIEPNGSLAIHAKRTIAADNLINSSPKSLITEDDLKDISFDNPDDLFSEAYSAFLYGDYDFSGKLYKKYISLKQNDDHAWYSYGEACLRAGLIDDAEQAFEKAAKLNPSKSIYYKQIGICHDYKEDYKKAQISFKKAVDAGKTDSMTLTLLGKAYLKNNESQNAIDYLTSAIKTNKQNLAAEFYLAEAYLSQNKIDKAAEHLHWVINTKINSPLKLKAKELLANTVNT